MRTVPSANSATIVTTRLAVELCAGFKNRYGYRPVAAPRIILYAKYATGYRSHQRLFLPEARAIAPGSKAITAIRLFCTVKKLKKLTELNVPRSTIVAISVTNAANPRKANTSLYEISALVRVFISLSYPIETFLLKLASPPLFWYHY